MLCNKLKKWVHKNYLNSTEKQTYFSFNFQKSLRDYGESISKKQQALIRAKNYLKKSHKTIDNSIKNQKLSKQQNASSVSFQKQNHQYQSNCTFQKLNYQKYDAQVLKHQTFQQKNYQVIFQSNQFPCIDLIESSINIQQQRYQQYQNDPQIKQTISHNQEISVKGPKLKTKLSLRILKKQLKNKNYAQIAQQLIQHRRLEFNQQLHIEQMDRIQQQQILMQALMEIVKVNIN